MGTALLFPGQGAQTVGMGQGLTQRSADAKDLFAEASEILGFDLLKLCLEGPAEELNRTEYSQPALFVHSYAALKELEALRPGLWSSVSAVAGLSLGEYTAVAAAGGITFADGVRLVQARGRAMQAAADATPSGMSSVLGLTTEQLDEFAKKQRKARTALYSWPTCSAPATSLSPATWTHWLVPKNFQRPLERSKLFACP